MHFAATHKQHAHSAWYIIIHTLVMLYLCVVCVGQVNSDHSGSKSPVREVHHLGLLKDRKSTKNVVARRIDIKT